MPWDCEPMGRKAGLQNLLTLRVGCRRHTRILSACPCVQGCMHRSSNACKPVLLLTYIISRVCLDHAHTRPLLIVVSSFVMGVRDNYSHDLSRTAVACARLKTPRVGRWPGQVVHLLCICLSTSVVALGTRRAAAH